MLGRHAERERLRGVLTAAEAGHGAAVVIAGEAGVGKSVLLDFVRETAAPSFLVLTATGTESESELPFAGLATLLRPVLADLERLPSFQAGALRAAIGLEPAQNVESLTASLGCFEMLVASSREQPVLLVLDDLHWLDGPTREAVLFLCRRVAGEAIVVLASVRTGEGTPVEVESLQELTLLGLDESSALALAREVRPNLTDAVARELWAGTSGNPLALVEIPPMLSGDQACGAAPLDEPLPVGRRLERVFARRLGDLEPETSRVLLVASASHTRALAVISAAAQHLGLDVRAVEAAETAGLIEVVDGNIAWRHPLLRSAAYHDASDSSRRDAHRALADSGVTESLGDHRAWHLAAAAAAPDEVIAQELEDLSERARSRGAMSTVARALRRAALLSPAQEQRARRMIAGAEAAFSVGRWDEASSMLADAVQRTDEPLMLAQGERIRARVEIVRGVPEAAHHRLVTIAESITELDRELAAMMMAEAVVAHMASGRWDAYLKTAERALELGREVGGATEAVAGIVLAAGLIVWGETEKGTRLLEQYATVVWEPAVWHAGPEIVGMYAFCNSWMERFEEAERLLDTVTDTARQAGAVRTLAYPLAVSAHLNLRRGRWQTALEQASEALLIARDTLGGAVLANNLAFLAQVEACLGDGESAREHARESLDLCQTLSLGAVATHARHALALLTLSEGDYEGVIRQVEAIPEEVVAGVTEPGHTLWDTLLIEAYIRTGQVQAAEAALERLEDSSTVTGRSIGHATAARCRGMICAQDDLDGHFQSALRWHTHANLPFERARTQLCYGERLRRAKRRGDARRQLADALDTFHALGAARWCERAQAELHVAGDRARQEQATAGWSELTSQQARVVELIIDGATYQEAADQLFLSPRTIESHLRQVYTKLGVRSRTELTRKLSRPPAAENPLT